jgi:hypothetical protein
MAVRTSAIAFATIYGAGFVIVNLHQARFGVSAFDLFKPKVFAAGVTFVGLVLVVAVLVFRIMGLAWWASTRSPGRARNWTAVLVFDIPTVFTGCAVLAQGLSVAVLSGDLSPLRNARTGGFFMLVGSVGLLATYWNFRGERLAQRPITGVTLAFASAAIFFFGHYLFIDRRVLWLSLWFSFIAFVVIFLYINTAPERRLTVAWEYNLGLFLATVFVYANFVYPNVRATWGGGIPAVVEVYFRDVPPFGGQTMNTRLLDENDRGFYVIPNEDSSVAYFLPREAVAFIKFERR